MELDNFFINKIDVVVINSKLNGVQINFSVKVSKKLKINHLEQQLLSHFYNATSYIPIKSNL